MDLLSMGLSCISAPAHHTPRSLIKSQPLVSWSRRAGTIALPDVPFFSSFPPSLAHSSYLSLSLSPLHHALPLICHSLSHDKIPVILNPLIGHFFTYSPSRSHLRFVFLPFLLLPSVRPFVCPLPDTSQTAPDAVFMYRLLPVRVPLPTHLRQN